MDGIFLIIIILAALGMMIGREYPRVLVQMFCDALLAFLKAVGSIVIYLIPPLASLLAKLLGAGVSAISAKIATNNSSSQNVQTGTPLAVFQYVPPVAQTAPQPIAQPGFMSGLKPEPVAPEPKPKTQNDKAINPYSDPPDIDIVS